MRARLISSALPLLAALSLAAPGCPEEDDGAALAVAAVSPVAGSARGGIEVALEGAGFADGIEVWFGDEEATGVEVGGAGELVAVTPPGTAGRVDVTVRNPDGAEAVLSDGFEVLPLSLSYVQAAAHFLPDLSDAEVADAAVADLDGDGDPDVLVAGRETRSRILFNAGNGSFTDPGGEEEARGPVGGLPPWRNDSRQVAVTDLDGDGAPDAFACNGGDHPDRLFRNTLDGAFEEISAGALEPDALGCAAAVAADVDGDGVPDLAQVVATPDQGDALRLLRGADGVDGRAWSPEEALEPPRDIDGEPVGEAWASVADITGAFTLTDTAVSRGAGAGRLDYDYGAAGEGYLLYQLAGPGIDEVPTAMSAQVLGDGSGHLLRLRLLDAADERFSADVGAVDWVGWAEVRLDDVASWTPSLGNEDGVIDLPLARVVLELHLQAGGPTSGTLGVDDVALEYDEAGVALVEDFERREHALAWPEGVSALAATDADGDGATDLVVALGTSGDGALRLLLGAGGGEASGGEEVPFAEAPAGALPALPDVPRWVQPLDADGDGDEDLLVITDGQDRLLRNDGSGHYFDDSVAGLPVDFAAGRFATTADLDRDGALDLCVANDGTVDRLYRNRGDGTFTDATPALPLHDTASVRVLPADVDGDHDLDLLVLQAGGAPAELYVSVEPEEEP